MEEEEEEGKEVGRGRREERGKREWEEGTGKVNVCMGGVGEVLDHPLWHLWCPEFSTGIPTETLKCFAYKTEL